MSLQFGLFVGIYQLQHWLAVINKTIRWTHSFLPLFQSDVMIQVKVPNIAARMFFCLYLRSSSILRQFRLCWVWKSAFVTLNQKKNTESQTRPLIIGGSESAIFRGITMINFGVKNRLHSLQYRGHLKRSTWQSLWQSCGASSSRSKSRLETASCWSCGRGCPRWVGAETESAGQRPRWEKTLLGDKKNKEITF